MTNNKDIPLSKKLRLFWLIHNERPYKRYYNEPLNHYELTFWHELVAYKNIFKAALRLPFNKNLNRQQFEGVRKSKMQMIKESLLWAIKYKEVCSYYFLYGLDIKGQNPNDYMGYTEFRVMRNIINIRQWENKRTRYTFNYLALVRDKFVFYQYCKSLKMPCPNTIALVSDGKISYHDENDIKWQNLDSILNKNFIGFCKETKGEAGLGAFSLEVKKATIFIDGVESTLNELKQRIGDATYIIQERLTNHFILKNIYPKSLNTLRLHTMLTPDGDVHFFSAVQRFGANGSVVDNGYAGGMFVGVNKHGILNDYGCHEPHTGLDQLIIHNEHPNSHKRFGGIQLPFWEEILETAKKFHRFMYGIPSIGWDIAIAEDGFYFTEAGEDWEIAFDQAANGPQRELFYKYHGQALDIKLRKY